MEIVTLSPTGVMFEVLNNFYKKKIPSDLTDQASISRARIVGSSPTWVMFAELQTLQQYVYKKTLCFYK